MPKRPELPADLFDLPIDGAASPGDGGEAAEESPEYRDSGVEAVDSDVDQESVAKSAARASGAVGNLPLFEAETSEADDSSGKERSAVSREVVAAGAVPSSGPPSGIFDQLPDPERDARDRVALEQKDAFEDETELEAAGFLVRLQAGAADLLAHLSVLSSALVAMKLLGLQPAVNQWPGFVSFMGLFSFLYLAFPLAFWGHTPGMAWFGLMARDRGDRPLAFGQTGIRVVASWLTVLLLGLPLFLALSGRSLADRLSGSETWIATRGG